MSDAQEEKRRAWVMAKLTNRLQKAVQGYQVNAIMVALATLLHHLAVRYMGDGAKAVEVVSKLQEAHEQGAPQAGAAP